MSDFIVSNLNSEIPAADPATLQVNQRLFCPTVRRTPTSWTKNVNGGEHTPSLMAGKQEQIHSLINGSSARTSLSIVPRLCNPCEINDLSCGESGLETARVRNGLCQLKGTTVKRCILPKPNSWIRWRLETNLRKSIHGRKFLSGHSHSIPLRVSFGNRGTVLRGCRFGPQTGYPPCDKELVECGPIWRSHLKLQTRDPADHRHLICDRIAGPEPLGDRYDRYRRLRAGNGLYRPAYVRL